VIRAIIASEKDRGCALFLTTHELNEAERLADRLVVMHQGRVLSQGTLEELAGSPEMIVQSSGPFDPAPLAALLGCAVVPDNQLQFRCPVASTPERIAIVTNFLASIGLSMVSLRTHASLEERYLELIADERHEVRP
jgi:ABC-2 type transport system ATP-binding protein